MAETCPLCGQDKTRGLLAAPIRVIKPSPGEIQSSSHGTGKARVLGSRLKVPNRFPGVLLIVGSDDLPLGRLKFLTQD